MTATFASDFAGLTALVTGGAEGLGRATAEMLVARGARVAILDLDVSGVPAGFVRVQADVTDRAAVDAAVADAAAQLGCLDVLVNNAGVGAIGTVSDNDDAEWAHVFDVNVFGMARVTAAALPWLRTSSNAAIVNVSSVAALNGLPQRALYSATKGAVLSLTLALAADHLREGIRVNCICPGTASTAWIDRLLSAADDPEAERAALNVRQPIGRLVDPDEVALAIAYLASPLAGSTTGTALDVDGGLTRLRLRPMAS